MNEKINFKIDGLNVELVEPEVEYADDLFHAIDHDRESLGKWLPWAYKINSAQDEADFIKLVQEKMQKHEIIALVILVNGKASGMIDLHHLVQNKKAEIGYWLSSEYQGHGIVTRSVMELYEYAFNELHLQYVDLIIAVKNIPSTRVAQHAGFKLMGIEPKLINNTLDGQIFEK